VTFIVAVVWAGVVLQLYVYVVPEASPEMPKLIVVPAQILAELGAITGVGLGVTVIAFEAVAVQPWADVTVTMYVVFTVGDTVIEDVVCTGVVFHL
jgi:hypothetical protein